MAENRIKIEPDKDFHLIGIASPLRDYKLCFHLNRVLECDFVKKEDQVFEPTDRSRKLLFSVFWAEDSEQKLTYLVFANKYGGEVLLPEAADFDYLMKITGPAKKEDIAELTARINGISEVLLTNPINVSKLKNHERLIYEEIKETPRSIGRRRIK